MPLPPEVRLNTELTALPDAKGEYRKQKAAATTRYFPGQKPVGLEEENDYFELKKPTPVAEVVEPEPQEEILQNKPDPRLERLAQFQRDDDSDDSDDERGSRRRRPDRAGSTFVADDDSSDEDEPSKPQAAAVAEVLEESSEDEDEIANRRAAIRARRLQREAEEAAAAEAAAAEAAAAAAEEEEKEEEEEEESSSEWETDSEDESNMVMQARAKPKFVPRSERETIHEQERQDAERAAADERKEQLKEERKKESHKMLEDELRKTAIEDNELSDVEMPDDDDEFDEEERYNAWKFRELKRVLAAREEREAAAKQAAEVERRRNLTDAQREEEDRKEKEKSMKAGKVQEKQKWGFMQKYYHKGAFFQDTDKHGVSKYDELFNRDYGGRTLGDHFNKESLPKVLQVKKFGFIGQTKYTHLLDQDTTLKEKDQGWGADPKLREKYLQKRAGVGDVARPSKKKRT